MASTLASLKLRVQSNLQGRDDLTSEISYAIDDACEELSHAFWRSLVTRDSTTSTVSGTQSIALPSDCEEVLRVQIVDNSSSYEVELLTKADVETRYPVADEFSSGTPAAVYREGSSLYFGPMPDAAYVVRVSYRAALSVASGSISYDGFDPLVVAYATAQVFESIEHGTVSATRWWAVYKRRLARKSESQVTTGTRDKMDTRLPNTIAPNPRLQDPTIVWWR